MESASRRAGPTARRICCSPRSLRGEAAPSSCPGVCLSWPGKQILGEVRVTGRGATPRDLVRALVPRLVQDAASTFEWDLTP